MTNNTVPTVFEKLLQPIDDFVKNQDQQLPRHPNQKFGYYDFFRILMYYFATGGKSFRLFIMVQLNNGLLPNALNIRPVPYSTIKEAFDRFSVKLFKEVFQYLLDNLPFKHLPELAKLGKLCCIDGSIFPVIKSMQWAEYTSKSQALKVHLCFELNRMLPVAFLVTSAKGNERQALLKMLEKGVTYIADRGYMSVKIYRQIVSAEANFIFRVKANLLYSVIEPLIVKLPENMKGILNVSDQLIRYTHDESKGIYRLVTFTLYQEVFYILTNRKDLTTYQIIVLYSYRWQIELIFRFLKRTLNGIHLIKQNEEGVTIQFYALLIVAMLQLYLKQITVERSTVGRNQRGRVKTTVITETESNSEKLESSEVGFLEKIGENLRKYWKIGIDWLTSLKELLSSPFDERAIRVLSKY
jgi:hypothetical protein